MRNFSLIFLECDLDISEENCCLAKMVENIAHQKTKRI